MSKPLKFIVCIALALILLLSLPFLYVFITGVIVGSFETFPRQDDVAVKRMVYTFISTAILIADIFAGVGLLRIVKTMRTK